MARLTEAELAAQARAAVAAYDGEGDDFSMYTVLDDQRQTYAITGIPQAAASEPSFVLIQARVVDAHIIVDVDALWDKQLWKRLVQSGVPREQIILAYLGEKVPLAS